MTIKQMRQKKQQAIDKLNDYTKRENLNKVMDEFAYDSEVYQTKIGRFRELLAEADKWDKAIRERKRELNLKAFEKEGV